jgi:antitoxin YefM
MATGRRALSASAPRSTRRHRDLITLGFDLGTESSSMSRVGVYLRRGAPLSQKLSDWCVVVERRSRDKRAPELVGGSDPDPTRVGRSGPGLRRQGAEYADASAAEVQAVGRNRTGTCPQIPIEITAEPVLAILVAMSVTSHVALADAKNRLSEVIERLERDHGRVVITKHGRPAAVMLSVEDLESLEETLGILSDPALMRSIRRAQREADAGKATRLTRAEALGLIKRP